MIPDCFSNFRGSEMKNSITNETESYSLSFGHKSEYDMATQELFKAYATKHAMSSGGHQ